MGQGFCLLDVEDDWKKYQTIFMKSCGISREVMQWGDKPQEYPCLVASSVVEHRRVLSCYVYPGEARKLLARSDPQLFNKPTARFIPEETINNDFTQQATALLLTIISLMVDTGIVKQKLFEERLAGFQSSMDQWKAEERDEFLASGRIKKD